METIHFVGSCRAMTDLAWAFLVGGLLAFSMCALNVTKWNEGDLKNMTTATEWDTR